MTRHAWRKRTFRPVKTVIDAYSLDEDLPFIKGAITDVCGFDAPSNPNHYLVDRAYPRMADAGRTI